MRVTLVRHAAPTTTADAHPSAWPLSPSGRAAARALRLPGATPIVASDERKALETLRLALPGRDVVVDPRFGEVRRPPELISPDFRQVRRAWVAGRRDARHERWETTEQAAQRFDDGVRARSGGHDLVVGTHGMVLTAWLVSVGHVTPGRAAAAFWEQLGLPGVVTVSLDG